MLCYLNSLRTHSILFSLYTACILLHILCICTRANLLYLYICSFTFSGTPLAEQATPPTPPSALEMTRMIAAARVLMPRSMVRLSAGMYAYDALTYTVLYIVCIGYSPYYIHMMCHILHHVHLLCVCTGRMGFTPAEQALMFLAGANSIFYGDQLLTTSNPEVHV